MKRLWILLLSLLLLSCSAGELPVTSAPSEQEGFIEEEGVLAIVADGLCRYTVIRPEICSEQLRKAAQSLDTWLFYRLKTHIPQKNDRAEEAEREILVGNTSREETRRVMEELEEHQFAVRIVGKKLVLCSPTDEGVKKAVEWFLKSYVKDLKLTDGQTPRLIVDLKEGYLGEI